MPGICAKALSMALISSSFVWNRVHCFVGVRATYTSPSLIPMASVAKSGRPILVVTSWISGKARSVFSTRFEISMESVSEMPGSLRVSTRMDPSSRRGMNSVPINAREASDPMTKYPGQAMGVTLAQPVHPIFCVGLVLLVVKAIAENERAEHGDHCKSEQQSSKQRGADRNRHRAEHASFEPLEKKNGKVDGDDNAYAERHGSSYLQTGS